MSNAQRRRAVIYCRISRDKSGEELGVERQESLCRELAARKDLDVTDVLVDNDLSAYQGVTRPGYMRLQGMIRDGMVEVVLIYHLDRLIRRTRDILDVIDLCKPHDVTVESVTGGSIRPRDPSMAMVATFMGTVAEHESGHKAERIAAAYEDRARKGRPKRGGRRMFGYELDAETFHQTEAPAVQEAARRIINGATLRSVTRWLTDEGFTSTRGNPLTPGAVRDILTNPRTAGVSTFSPTDPSTRTRLKRDRRIVAEGQWPGILDADTFARVEAVLTDPARATNRVGNTPQHLASGLLTCTCGEPMYYRTRRRANGSQRGFYSCKKATGGDHVSIGDEVEELLAELAITRLSLTDMTELVTSALATGDGEDAGDRFSELVGQRDTLGQRQERLAQLFADGQIDESMFAATTREINDRLTAVDASLDALRARATEHSVLMTIPVAADSADVETVIRDWWNQADLEHQREIIGLLLTATVTPGKHGRKTFDPDRLQVTWR